MRRLQERRLGWQRGDIRGVLLGEIRLPIRPESAGSARRFLRVTTLAWGLSTAADTVELLGCELVTNIIRYAATMPGSTLRLLVIRDRERLRVEAHDPSVEPPTIKVPGHDAIRGRGLLIVGALSAATGWHPTGHGKAVWFELPVSWPVAP